MSKFISSLLLVCISLNSISAFAACEEERKRTDRARKIADDWSQASVITAGAGAIIGGCLFGPLGGLCGAAGLLPGIGALRATHLLREREKILKACLDQDAQNKERERQAEIRRGIDQCAADAADFLTDVMMAKQIEYQRLAEQEYDEYLERLMDTDERDLDDPEVLRAIREENERERQRINARYF